MDTESRRPSRNARAFAVSVLVALAILCFDLDVPPSSQFMADDHGEPSTDLRFRRSLLSWRRKKWLRRQERRQREDRRHEREDRRRQELEEKRRLRDERQAVRAASQPSSLADYPDPGDPGSISVRRLKRREEEARKQAAASPSSGGLDDLTDPDSVALPVDAEEVASDSERMFVEAGEGFELATAEATIAQALAEGATTFAVRPADNAAGDTSLLFQPSEVLIEILNPKSTCAYSVTIASHGKYTGTARLWEGYEFRSSETLVHSWMPSFPGLYHVLVHELCQFGKMTPLIEPVNYPVLINEGQQPGAGMALLKQRIVSMPPCQTVPDPHVYSHWDGDWLGPDFGLEESIRTGWSFLPSPAMNCKVETFSKEMIQAIPAKKKIYILGRSVERGVFLSLLDLMLDRKEKANFRHSVIAKCWGRATITKGNLEIMYQDFRVNSFEDPRKPRYIECHNEKIVKQPGSSFLANATQVWEEMFDRNAPGEWPSVVFMVTGLGAMHFRFSYHVHEFVKMLPQEWTGTLFLGDFSFSARDGGLYNRQKYQTYLQKVSGLMDILNDPRVRWFDGMGLSKEMRMYSQKGEEKVSGSQHFHKPCQRANVFDPDDSIAVCSNVTEVVAQVLLGHALGPKAEFVRAIAGNPNPTPLAKTTPRVCTACPDCMIPFHIAPRPSMKCVDGPIQRKTYAPRCDEFRWEKQAKQRGEGEKANELVCPAACMETPPASSFDTESDTVFVRQCPIVWEQLQ